MSCEHNVSIVDIHCPGNKKEKPHNTRITVRQRGKMSLTELFCREHSARCTAVVIHGKDVVTKQGTVIKALPDQYQHP